MNHLLKGETPTGRIPKFSQLQVPVAPCPVTLLVLRAAPGSVLRGNFRGCRWMRRGRVAGISWGKMLKSMEFSWDET